MNKCKLSDITIQIYDGKHGGCTKANNSGYYFISVKDIINLELKYETAMQIPKNEFDKIFKRTNLEEGDTLYANTGDTIGKSVYVFNHPLIKHTAFQKSVAVIKPNKEKVYSPYLYYLMAYETPRLRAAASGSGQKNLLLDTMRNFETAIHDVPEQHTIADTLLAIDKKIINNNHIVKAMEDYVRLIYSYWFIQFDFPNDNGNPYKDSGGKMVWNETIKKNIPDGWAIDSIGSLITEREKSSVQVNETIGNYGEIPFFTSGDEIIMYNKSFTSGKNCFLNTGGNADVKYHIGDAAYSTDTWCISADDYSSYLYMYIDSIKKYLNVSFFSGSGLKHLQKDAFKNHLIVVPPKKQIQLFNETADKCFSKISKIKTENQSLTDFRNFLLPLLMNNQVKIMI